MYVISKALQKQTPVIPPVGSTISYLQQDPEHFKLLKSNLNNPLFVGEFFTGSHLVIICISSWLVHPLITLDLKRETLRSFNSSYETTIFILFRNKYIADFHAY